MGLASSSHRVLGVRVDAAQIPETCTRVEEWIQHRDCCRYVAATGMHGIMEAQPDPTLKSIHNAADLVLPDGMPLVWLGQFRGRPLARRVYAPDLMRELCRRTASTSCHHFLVGGGCGVAGRLATVLERRFPGIVLSGTCSPPFQPLTKGQAEK
jgi:N-acetylglucosaminyldiphosphoundecaprenol N-acetyl-beta-D-mannosaminyltransferase